MASRFRPFFNLLLLPCVLVVGMLSAAEAGRTHAPLLETAAAPATQPVGAAPAEFLPGQNEARAAVGVDKLRWSAVLALEAARVVRRQEAEKRCGFADLSSSRWGANQAWASYPLKPADAVRSWVAEGKYYSYRNNSCAAGHECGTYTQVVWRRTAEVGCAQATCAAAGARQGGASLTVCLYDPAGNIEGQQPFYGDCC